MLPKFRPTLTCDVTQLDYRAHYAAHSPPDVVWASPSCRTFSVANWGKHRGGDGGATSADGAQGDACVRACLEIIEHLRTLNPQLVYFVENPAYGAIRMLDCVRPHIEHGAFRQVQYGDYAPDTHSMKPALVLTNCARWHARPMVIRKSLVHWNHLSKKRRTVMPRTLYEEIVRAVVLDVSSASCGGCSQRLPNTPARTTPVARCRAGWRACA